MLLQGVFWLINIREGFIEKVDANEGWLNV